MMASRYFSITACLNSNFVSVFIFFMYSEMEIEFPSCFTMFVLSYNDQGNLLNICQEKLSEMGNNWGG